MQVIRESIYISSSYLRQCVRKNPQSQQVGSQRTILMLVDPAAGTHARMHGYVRSAISAIVFFLKIISLRLEEAIDFLISRLVK